MIFCLHLLSALCRFLSLNPNEQFVFYDDVEQPGVYKFIFDIRQRSSLVIYDPSGQKAYETTQQNGSVYINIVTPGLVKIVASNLSDKVCKFSYKAPDTNKEVTGYLGYVGEEDLIGELTTILDRLVDQQNVHISNTYKHYEMVKRSRTWIRLLVVFELILTAIAVYFMHKDFISMFETKRKL